MSRADLVFPRKKEKVHERGKGEKMFTTTNTAMDFQGGVPQKEKGSWMR